MFSYCLFFVALYVFTNHFLNKIKNLPPSPFPTLPIIGHLYLCKKSLHRALSKISARYGPIVLLQLGSRRVLLVSSPSTAEECLTKNDITFANRPHLFAGKHVGYNYTSLVWAPYGDHWRNIRKISSLEIFCTYRLETLSSVRLDEVRLLVRKLYENQNQTVEMKSAFYELMLNVMMRMVAGRRYDSENVGGMGAKEFQEIVSETFRLGGASNITDYLPVLKWIGFGGAEKRLINLQKKRDAFMQSLVEEHRRMMKNDDERKYNLDGSRQKTIIEVLLSLQEHEPEYYKDEMIRSLMLVLLVAGSDASSGTMEWAMSLLLNKPEILEKAQAEIDSQVGFDHFIDELDLAKLPYLRCIINETMRMYPPLPLLIPHESSQECTIGGFCIPRGTMLFVNLWDIQRDPKIWEEPTKFKPERFEGLEGMRDGFKLMPFGSGRRSCPGEGLALRMVGLAIGSLLQCFEWERVSEELVDLTEGTGLTLPRAQSLRAKCRPRPVMANLFLQSE